ncbi:hypothetical protein Tco_0915427 [Tanacetum coccineum]
MFCAKQYRNSNLRFPVRAPFCTSKIKRPRNHPSPSTKKQVDDLFQWFDDDEVVPITPVNVPAAPTPEHANGSPSTTVISEGGPAVTENLLPHQIPLPLSLRGSRARLSLQEEEIQEFERLDVWDTCACTDNLFFIIPLKWIFKIMLDEYGDVLKNKCRFVAKGYSLGQVLNMVIFLRRENRLPQRRLNEVCYVSQQKDCRSCIHRMCTAQEKLYMDSNKLHVPGI